MLHILLLILKIIGIFLAALLGIVALVLIGVLFVPVRYHIEAEGKLGNENPVHVGVKVSWLLHIVNVAFAYPEAVCVRVKIFCFTLFDSSKIKKAEEKKKKKKAVVRKKNRKFRKRNLRRRERRRERTRQKTRKRGGKERKMQNCRKEVFSGK